MGNRALGAVARLACVLPVLTLLLLTIGPTGCGSGTPPTGTQSQLAPEAVKANQNMEDFMKTQKKAKSR
jgi:hypothetical protein